MEGPLLIENHEEFPQLGATVHTAASTTANDADLDSSWVNLPSPPRSTRNPKFLRHCASSPDMRHPRDLPMLQEEVFDEANDSYDDGCGDENFTLISAATPGPPLSFRDAAILTKTNDDNVSDNDQDDNQLSEPSQAPIRQAKFVVVHAQSAAGMKRCAKSTGDLQSLSEHSYDSDVMGETDAMDYYHRKALGAKGRASGLRMRPDEAKRKEFTLNKKSMQRAGQA